MIISVFKGRSIMCRLKHYLAILCIAVIIVVTLCGCGVDADSGDGIILRLEYDTLEEMQADFPEFYYFTFNEAVYSDSFGCDTKIANGSFRMFSADQIKKNKGLYDYNYDGYQISYVAKSAFVLYIESGNRSLGNLSAVEYLEHLTKQESYAGNIVIDNLDCCLFDYRTVDKTKGINCFFALDNLIYVIGATPTALQDGVFVELLSLEKYIPLFTNIIENRYKGSSSPLVNIMCDNVEEVQTYLPDFSYFDFDYAKMSTANIKSKEQTDPNKETIEYDFYSYSINFKEYPVGIEPNIRNANITVYANKEKTIEELFPNIKDDYTDYLYSEHTVDGIQCIMTYSSLDSDNNYTIKLIFELDNVTYYIQLDETLEDIDAEQLTEQDFLAFIEPIIKNR